MGRIDYKKGLWFGPSNLETRITLNGQNTRQDHTFHDESHWKLHSWINSKAKPRWDENLKGHVWRRLILTPAICYWYDAPQLYTEEMHLELEI